MNMRRFLVVPILCCAKAAWAAGSPRLESARASAAALFREGRYAQSLPFFRQAAELAPKDAAVLKDRLWALWYAGRYAEAAEAAEAVRALGEDLEALNLEGRCELELGRRETALDLFQGSLAKNPNQPAVARMVARLDMALKRYPEALRAFEALSRSEPGDPALLDDLGKARFDLAAYGGKPFDQARRLYVSAAQSWAAASALAPEATTYALPEARALYLAGDEERALALALPRARSVPPDWDALDFAVDSLLIMRRGGDAAKELERALRGCGPAQGPRWLRLIEIYDQMGRYADLNRALDRLLAVDPGDVAALLRKGSYLMEIGRTADAERIFRRLAAAHPEAQRAWIGAAQAAYERDPASREAATLLERARRRDRSPALASLQARYLYEAGDAAASRRLLDDVLAQAAEGTLPVLLYHGVLTPVDNPALAETIHVTTAALRVQLKALRDAGYVAIGIDQAAAWFRGEKGLPSKPVLITFDDARLDSFLGADPILAKLGMRATMFAPLSNVDGGFPGFASWDELARYQATGRWDIQAHADQGHKLIPTDGEGRRGIFLVNRRWNEREKRPETEAEWRSRVESDYVSVRTKLRDRLGASSAAFAFPEGDYGQMVSNEPAAVDVNLRACRRNFSLCFHQDPYGVNVRGQDPSQAVRVEPRNDWSGPQLLQLLTDQNPSATARRTLALEASWDDKPYEALRWVAENRRAGVSPAFSALDEGRVLFAAGDRVEGLRLAYNADQLEGTPESHRLVEELRQKMRPIWTPALSYYHDDRGRENVLLSQAIDAWAVGDNLFGARLVNGSFRENGLETVFDMGGGIVWNRSLSMAHHAEASVLGHFFSGEGHNTVAATGALGSRWTDAFSTELKAGHDVRQTARAIEANVRDRYVGATATYKDDERWRGQAAFNYDSISDGNQRYTGVLTASWALPAWRALKLAYQLTADDTRFVSPNYYSPQRLLMNQAGPELALPVGPEAKADVRYLAGYGDERASAGEFVQDLTAELEWTRDRLTLKPSILLTRTPTYKSETYTLTGGWRF